MIVYRPGTPADAEAVLALFRASFLATFGHMYAPADVDAFFSSRQPGQWRAELCHEDYAFRLAHDGDTLVGFVKLGPPSLPFDPGERRALELRQLYVAAGYHGQGIAQALTDWLIMEARRRGADDLYLSVFTDNHRARAFYRRYGWQDVGEYKFIVGNIADDDIVCRLDLTK